MEKNYSLGGLAGGEYWHGFPVSRYAYAIGLMPRELIAYLNLFGDNDLVEPEPSWVELGEDQEVLFRWWRSREKLRQEFFERGMGDAYTVLELAERFWKCYKERGLYYTPSPPSLGEAARVLDECDREAVVFLEKRVEEILGEYMPRDYWDLLIYPSMFSANGFSLAYYLQERGVWRLPSRSMKTFSARLRGLAVRSNVDLLLGERVKAITVRRGNGGKRVEGVVLASGKRLQGRIVIYNAPIPSLLRLEGASELEEWEIRSLEKLSQITVPVVRVDYFVRGKPSPPREEGWRGVPIYVYWTREGGGDYTYYYGRHNSIIQLSGYPSTPLSPLPPGTRIEAILDYRVKDWRSQDKCCANPTGHPDHIPMIDPYLFDQRPIPGWGSYTTSIEGLYHASASSYPGGEVNGVAGVNAALKILVDKGLIEKAEGIRKSLVSLWRRSSAL